MKFGKTSTVHVVFGMLLVPAICLMLGFGLRAEDKPAAKPLKEATLLKFENLSLRLQLLERGIADVKREQQELYAATCKEAGVELSTCQIDPKSMTVTAAPKPQPEQPKSK